MPPSKQEPPKDSAGGRTEAASKAPARTDADRLAAALRDNLKRRKAQARARQEPRPGRHEG